MKSEGVARIAVHVLAVDAQFARDQSTTRRWRCASPAVREWLHRVGLDRTPGQTATVAIPKNMGKP